MSNRKVYLLVRQRNADLDVETIERFGWKEREREEVKEMKSHTANKTKLTIAGAGLS